MGTQSQVGRYQDKLVLSSLILTIIMLLSPFSVLNNDTEREPKEIEEIEIGDVTSGAAGDIRMATNIARSMVCDWGMSSLGPIAFGDNEEHLFLGREISKTHNLSEETAKRIDEEVSKIITTQFDRAKKLIEENREGLTKIAEALLEFETIEGKHVQEIVEYGEIRSEVISNKTEEEKRKQEESEKEDSEEKKASDKSEDIPPAVDGAQAMA